MLGRRAYDRLVEWKARSRGTSALLVEGARRVGKTTLVTEFAEREYDAHLLVDFSAVPPDVRDLFEDYRHDVGLFLRLLQAYYGVSLPERRSLVVFDEVQRLPIAREFIKHLVADGRYDHVETGSLIPIRRNIDGILIPSEERSLELCPLDFEEFLWAAGEGPRRARPRLLRQPLSAPRAAAPQAPAGRGGQGAPPALHGPLPSRRRRCREPHPP